MKRALSLFLSFVLLCSGLPLAHADLRAAGVGAPAGTYSQAQQITASHSLAVPYIVAKTGIPIVDAATGTMANNGALTLGTALSTTYANAYVVLPANAISAGSLAGTYFMQCTTTTACTVFNNTYTSGIPTIPASPTPFATTGPGAFTGNTSLDTLVSISIPANTMGANGAVRITTITSETANANSHIVKHNFGGSDFLSINVAGAGSYMAQTIVMNRGVTNSQVGGPPNGAGAGGWGSGAGAAAGFSSVDTTGAVTVAAKSQKAVATDNMVLEFLLIESISDGT